MSKDKTMSICIDVPVRYKPVLTKMEILFDTKTYKETCESVLEYAICTFMDIYETAEQRKEHGE